MENFKSYKEKLGNQINSWRQEFDHLKLQLALGKMEASEKYEKNKQSFKKYSDEFKQEFNENSDDNVLKLKQMIEELEVKLSLGKLEAKDVYAEYKGKLNDSIDDILGFAKRMKKTGKEKFDENATNLKTKLDIVKLHFALGKMDAKDGIKEETSEIKEELKDAIDDISKELKEVKGFFGDAWDETKDEISEATNYLGKKFKGFFKKK